MKALKMLGRIGRGLITVLWYLWIAYIFISALLYSFDGRLTEATYNFIILILVALVEVVTTVYRLLNMRKDEAKSKPEPEPVRDTEPTVVVTFRGEDAKHFDHIMSEHVIKTFKPKSNGEALAIFLSMAHHKALEIEDIKEGKGGINSLMDMVAKAAGIKVEEKEDGLYIDGKKVANNPDFKPKKSKSSKKRETEMKKETDKKESEKKSN